MFYNTIKWVSTRCELRRAKTGPNDARRVVWALEVSIFFSFVFFSYLLMFFNSYSLYTTKYEEWRVGTTKTGPNDAKQVVWTLGE